MKVADALSRKDIREMALLIRKVEGVENEMYFDIIHFMEITLPKIIPGFCFRVLDKNKMGAYHGLTQPSTKTVFIREDVYDRAISGSGRDRLTIAHELFHFLVHNNESVQVQFGRTGDGEDKKLPAYLDPEWQADAFGGELLIPFHLIKNKTLNEVVVECGVSSAAAKYQMKFV